MGQIAMTDQEILEQFADVVVESLRIDRAKVTADAYLNDLGAESLDLLEITMETEDRFNILMPQKNILQVAQEVFGEGVLVGDGRLTEEGMKLLRRRTPEVDRLLDDPTPALADVSRMFLRVEVWIRMIRGLMEQSPRSCPKCDAAFGKAVAGRLKDLDRHAILAPDGSQLRREGHRLLHRINRVARTVLDQERWAGLADVVLRIGRAHELRHFGDPPAEQKRLRRVL